jgi:hypothetical protein
MSLTKRLLGVDVDRRIAQNSGQYGGDIDFLAREWAQKTANQLKRNIARKKITLTKELLDSVTFSVNDGDTPSISFEFAEHGRFLDMKELFWHKVPPVDTLEAWVQQHGVRKFKFVPGYARGKGFDDPRAARRIAWGIARDRASGEAVNQYGRWKRSKTWINPDGGKKGKTNLGTAIGHLRHLLEEELAGTVENLVVYAITN